MPVSGWDLPENEAVAARIREAAGRGSLFHALLLSGAGDLASAAQFAAAALECTANGEKPCGVCPSCRKVRAGIHPDVTVVRDTEHKNIAVDVVRSARGDAYIRPNEGARKVYLFEDCSLLTEQDQNVLLKLVEEGPPYAAFVFCAENPALVLPTLRSRCVELKLRPSGEGKTLSPEAEALCRAVGRKDPCGVTEALIRLERRKLAREDLKKLLEESLDCFAAALLLTCGEKLRGETTGPEGYLAKNLTKIQIMRTIELLQKYRDECLYNVGPGHVLGALAVEWEGIL